MISIFNVSAEAWAASGISDLAWAAENSKIGTRSTCFSPSEAMVCIACSIVGSASSRKDG